MPAVRFAGTACASSRASAPELTRLFTWEERHRRLAARLLIAFGLTLLVLAVGSVLIWAFESGVKGGDIHGYGDAVFFTAVQLLTISSAITNHRPRSDYQRSLFAERAGFHARHHQPAARF